MWRRLTSAWTDAHAGLIAGATILATLGALAVSGSVTALSVALSTIVVALVAFVLASLTDAFGGMLVGLLAAAAFTVIHQYLPAAAPLSFATQAVTLGLLFLLGMSSGIVADRMRRARRISSRQGGHAIMPVEGSLGLLSPADAATALAHEHARAELHDRPLSTATIQMVFTDQRLGEEEVRRARRAVARSLETELRVTDLVYVDAEGHFGAILPETTAAGAIDVIESALIVARSATFADREVGTRKPVADVAELQVEITPVIEPQPAPVPVIAETLPPRVPNRRKPRATAAKSTGAARSGARTSGGRPPAEPAV